MALRLHLVPSSLSGDALSKHCSPAPSFPSYETWNPVTIKGILGSLVIHLDMGIERFKYLPQDLGSILWLFWAFGPSTSEQESRNKPCLPFRVVTQINLISVMWKTFVNCKDVWMRTFIIRELRLGWAYKYSKGLIFQWISPNHFGVGKELQGVLT